MTRIREVPESPELTERRHIMADVAQCFRSDRVWRRVVIAKHHRERDWANSLVLWALNGGDRPSIPSESLARVHRVVISALHRAGASKRPPVNQRIVALNLSRFPLER